MASKGNELTEGQDQNKWAPQLSCFVALREWEDHASERENPGRAMDTPLGRQNWESGEMEAERVHRTEEKDVQRQLSWSARSFSSSIQQSSDRNLCVKELPKTMERIT